VIGDKAIDIFSGEISLDFIGFSGEESLKNMRYVPR
jgi:hypothetical protein